MLEDVEESPERYGTNQRMEGLLSVAREVLSTFRSHM